MISKMAVKTATGQVIGNVEFNTGDFSYEGFQDHRLILNLKETKETTKDETEEGQYQEQQAYLDIGLKGTKTDGVIRKKMIKIRQQI